MLSSCSPLADITAFGQEQKISLAFCGIPSLSNSKTETAFQGLGLARATHVCFVSVPTEADTPAPLNLATSQAAPVANDSLTPEQFMGRLASTPPRMGGGRACKGPSSSVPVRRSERHGCHTHSVHPHALVQSRAPRCSQCACGSPNSARARPEWPGCVWGGACPWLGFWRREAPPEAQRPQSPKSQCQL